MYLFIKLNYIEDQLVFQQDGASLHVALFVFENLDQTFPGHRIRRRGPIIQGHSTFWALRYLILFCGAI